MRPPFRLALLALVLLLPFVALPGSAQDGCDDGTCAWRSGSLDKDEAWSYTFTEAREYGYHCHPHPWMQGKVVVQAAPDDHEPETHRVLIREGDPDDTDTWAFFPDALTVKTGDTVIWTNGGKTAHDVMGFAGAEQQAAHEADHDHDHEVHGHETAESPGAGPLALIGLVAMAIALVVRRD